LDWLEISEHENNTGHITDTTIHRSSRGISTLSTDATSMKRFTSILGLLALTAGSTIAGIEFLCNTPPPMELSMAYPLAVKALGTNATQYHCVGAIPMMTQNYYTNHLSGEWSFNFVATNGIHQQVWVFFDDKTAEIVHPTGF
jgi:hypothetical protein